MKTFKNKIVSRILIMAVLFSLLTIISCKKKTPTPPPIQYGTMTDVDNNTYKTVKIGNQWWMAENLKTTKYRNGWPIFQMTNTSPDSVWGQLTKGAYCAFDYNSQNQQSKYGLLYNWYTITDTNIIAPAGWHVPSDDEWKTLEIYLGMSQANADAVNWRGDREGDKLKVASPADWIVYGDVWSTNESGFAAMAGCCRMFDGVWGDPGTSNTGFWWTSTAHPSNNQAWYRYLDYKKTNVFRYNGPKSYGMSIRCVKD